jgi:hypothetical protein
MSAAVNCSPGDPPDAIICQVCFFIGAIYRDGRIVWRTVFDLLTVDIEVNQSVRPIVTPRIGSDRRELFLVYTTG